MVISKVPRARRLWVVGELLAGNALAWCASCGLVRPADLVCSRCGSPAELIPGPLAYGLSPERFYVSPRPSRSRGCVLRSRLGGSFGDTGGEDDRSAAASASRHTALRCRRMAWKIERAHDLFLGTGGFLRDHLDVSSREMVIVGCSMLDVALADLIAARLRDDPEEVCDFIGADEDGRAPLGSFGARIQAAYLLGLIGQEHLETLRALKKVRNLLSHRVKVDLLTPRVQAAIEPLRTWFHVLSPKGRDPKSQAALRYLQSTADASRTDAKAAHFMIAMEIDVTASALQDWISRVPRSGTPMLERLRPEALDEPGKKGQRE